jgi:hypothetical protein
MHLGREALEKRGWSAGVLLTATFWAASAFGQQAETAKEGPLPPPKGRVTIEVAPAVPEASSTAVEPPSEVAPVNEEDDSESAGVKVYVPHSGTMPIPSDWVERGYSLRVDGERAEITAKGATIETDEDSTVELIDHGGRVVGVIEGDAVLNTLSGLYPRTWRVGLGSGMMMGSPTVWSRLLLPGTAYRLETEVFWRGGPWGLGMILASEQNSFENDRQVLSQYQGIETAFLGSWLWTPFKNQGVVAARIHMEALLGAVWGYQIATLEDSVVSLRGTSKGWGTIWGTSVRYPLIANWWGRVRWLSTRQAIEMPNLGFQTSAPRSSLVFGVDYAF